MAGSTFGNIFKITTWGESHGKALGVVVDGCPAGLPLSEEEIQKYLDRRKPGTSAITTQRKEADQVEILSGVFDGKTTGTPISLMVRNTSQISADYSEIAENYRPGHADYCFDAKYGFRDYRGGGRSSGRETIGRVAAGAIAAKILEQMGITVFAYTRSIGPIDADPAKYNRDTARSTITAMPDAEADEKACAYLHQARETAIPLVAVWNASWKVFPPESETLFLRNWMPIWRRPLCPSVPLRLWSLVTVPKQPAIPAARTTIPSAWRTVKLSRPAIIPAEL